jgi:hypothetical protein
MLPLMLMLLLLCNTTIAVADTRKEFFERQKVEFQKFHDEVENLCIGLGEAWFSYAPLDRARFHPVHFSPSLQPDIVKRITAGLGSLRDPRIREALDGPFNDAVNERIEGLRSGRLNNINLVVAKGIGISITPSEHLSDDVVVWVARSFLERLLDVADGERPHDSIYILSADGSMRPLDEKSRPKWLESRNLRDYLWSGSGSDRVRLKKMVRCTYQSLPK